MTGGKARERETGGKERQKRIISPTLGGSSGEDSVFRVAQRAIPLGSRSVFREIGSSNRLNPGGRIIETCRDARICAQEARAASETAAKSKCVGEKV